MAKKNKNVEVGTVPLRVVDPTKMYLRNDMGKGKIGKDTFVITNPMDGSIMSSSTTGSTSLRRKTWCARLTISFSQRARR